MSALAIFFDEYLRTRRALGFKLERAAHLLPDFIAYIDRTGASRITSDLALTWAQQPANANRSWWATRLNEVRVFAKFVKNLDDRNEVPPPDLLGRPLRRNFKPYLYSQAEVAALIAAARALPTRLRAATCETVIGLLAATGMRIGECIRLDSDDVDWANELLVVRDTKFGKSREVPLHHSTIAALDAYRKVRNDHRARPRSPAFFVSRVGRRLNYDAFHRTFRQLVQHAGLEPRSPGCRPRIHDLRHTFAMRTLEDWHRDRVDVEAWMPRLSTYLGHSEPSSTYWYLSATPELLATAAKRLESNLEALP